MEPINEKYISSDNNGSDFEDAKARITGDAPSAASPKITGDQTQNDVEKNDEPVPTQASTAAQNNVANDSLTPIRQSTSAGGLTQIPYDFEQKEGSWQFIFSNNPFEILYLDYTQSKIITPLIVETNYSLLSTFWQNKLLLMNGAAREKMKARYGEETINSAQKKLEVAYQKLRTTEGINNYYRELENKRFATGISAISGLIEVTFADGELTPNEANVLIAKGMEKNLSEAEVSGHILQILREQEFEIRSKPPKEEPLKNIWRQKGIKDPPQNIVFWLGSEVASLAELGEVSFNKKEAAYNRFRNINYLPQAVMSLTRDDSKAEMFEKIIEQTHDEDIRYLKIIYRLNPELPFRFRGSMHHTIKSLLNHAQTEGESFWKADEMFKSGNLQTWISETDAATALLLRSLQRTTTDFLKFIYQIDWNYPFYLNQTRIDYPQDLAKILQQDKSLWPTTTNYIRSGYISTWLMSIGKNNTNNRYNQMFEPVSNAGWYTDEDRNMAAVHTLIRAIDEKALTPWIIFDTKKIELLNIEGTGNVSHHFSLEMQSPGYATAFLQLSNAPEGIELSANRFSFFNLNQQTKADVRLDVDVFKLVKNRTYQFKVIAITPYQTVELPVDLKVVFPANSFIKKMAVYGLGSGAMWATSLFLMLEYSRTIYTLISFVVLFIYGKIIELALKKEFAQLNKPSINKFPFRLLLLSLFLLGPTFGSAYSQPFGLWFFYWLFAGATIGMYVACKKYNLNKLLPLLPLMLIILIGLATKETMLRYLLRHL